MEKNENRQIEWKKLIEEYSKSGLRKTDFCKQKGITPGRFYYHESELKRAKEKGLKDVSTFVPVALKQQATLPLPKNSQNNSIQVILKNGIECIIPTEINSIRFKEIIEVLVKC